MKNYCDRCNKLDKQTNALVDIKVGVIHIQNSHESREFWRAVGGFPKKLSLCDLCFVESFVTLNDKTVGEKNVAEEVLSEDIKTPS